MVFFLFLTVIRHFVRHVPMRRAARALRLQPIRLSLARQRRTRFGWRNQKAAMATARRIQGAIKDGLPQMLQQSESVAGSRVTPTTPIIHKRKKSPDR